MALTGRRVQRTAFRDADALPAHARMQRQKLCFNGGAR